MPEFVQNVPTQNAYASALTLGPADNVAQITFTITGQPAYAQFWKPIPGKPGKQTLEPVERLFIANTIGAVARQVAGVRFRSAISGQPANIIAEMAFLTDPQIEGGTVSGANISGGGQITPPGAAAVTGRVNSAGAILAGSGFTAARLGVGDYLITYTDPFAAQPVVLAATLSGANLACYIQNSGLSSVEIRTEDFTGTPQDSSFEFAVFPMV